MWTRAQLKVGCLPVAESTVSILCRKLAINVIWIGRLLKFCQHNNRTCHRKYKTRLRRGQRSQIYFPLPFCLSPQERQTDGQEKGKKWLKEVRLLFFVWKKKDPEGKESHRKIGPLMNEENREINDDLKRLSYWTHFLNLPLTRETKQKKYIDN